MVFIISTIYMRFGADELSVPQEEGVSTSRRYRALNRTGIHPVRWAVVVGRVLDTSFVGIRFVRFVLPILYPSSRRSFVIHFSVG